MTYLLNHLFEYIIFRIHNKPIFFFVSTIFPFLQYLILNTNKLWSFNFVYLHDSCLLFGFLLKLLLYKGLQLLFIYNYLYSIIELLLFVSKFYFLIFSIFSYNFLASLWPFALINIILIFNSYNMICLMPSFVCKYFIFTSLIIEH